MIKLRNKPSRADRAHSLALKEPRPHCVFKGIPLVWANRWISLGVSVVYTSFRCLVANQRVFYEALVWLWEVRLQRRLAEPATVLDLEGRWKHGVSCTSTATPTLTPRLYKHTLHTCSWLCIYTDKSWCSYTSLFPHCSCGPSTTRHLWTVLTDMYTNQQLAGKLVRESDVGEQYRAIDTWLCLYNYWLCRSILYSLCCCIVALQMSVVPAVLCPLCQLSIFPFKISSFLSLVITFCHLSPDSAHSSCW